MGHVNATMVPHWQELECEAGHKYVFSETTHNWMDSVAECELYGGWLVNIESLAEQNSLMRYAQKNGLFNDYWTDGNDIETEGVFVHASTGEDLTWINSKWVCGKDANSLGGDAFALAISSDGRYNGNWCDVD